MKKVMIPSLDMKKSISVKVDSDLTLLLSSGVYEIKKMEPRWRLRRPIIVFCLFLTIAGIIGFGYYCPDQVCALSRRDVTSSVAGPGSGGLSGGVDLTPGFEHDNLGKPVQQNLLANPGLSYEEVLNDDFQFDMNAHDVMVFLHIQKTGGTSFGKHLVRDLDLKVIPPKRSQNRSVYGTTTTHEETPQFRCDADVISIDGLMPYRCASVRNTTAVFRFRFGGLVFGWLVRESFNKRAGRRESASPTRCLYVAPTIIDLFSASEMEIRFSGVPLGRPCTCQRKKKRCYCFRPHRNENWLFSRYSTGWKCGLHADWTELTGCVDQELDKNEGETAKRRYFYITLLREPIARYLSEFRHVQRGATWKNARHWCLGRHATSDELPPCYNGESNKYEPPKYRRDYLLRQQSEKFLQGRRALRLGANWNGVALDEFAGCESNLAANRQTRMLADLALVGCYNKTYMPAAERDRIMLASAKRNLAAMSYFGLTEYQKISQYIFEETFNLRFAIPFEQHNTTVSTVTMNSLMPSQRARIDQLNALDLELYAFAKKLMFQRFERLKAKDNDFEVRFAHLGNLEDRDRAIITTDGTAGGRRRRQQRRPLPAIGPLASTGGANHSAVAHQNSINHQRATGSGGGGGSYIDNPISAKPNPMTSPSSSERRRKKTNKQQQQQRIRKREDDTRQPPTVNATKLLQR
uniref:Heparan-sulfate 6-O-sulfotransferase n=1 Tax=Anopheles farauti TaxID=69004 RepID=A0A182Q3F9_9DIPT